MADGPPPSAGRSEWPAHAGGAAQSDATGQRGEQAATEASPNRGGEVRELAAPPPGLPSQRRGTTPQMRGRYPDYDVLATAEHWDATTRAVVLARVADIPPIRFFTEEEERTLRAFCDLVTAQDSEPRIPVLEMVDARLHAGMLDGFRHHDMPPDPETWRQVATYLDHTARSCGSGEGFARAGVATQHEIVERFSKGELDWPISATKAWGVVMRGVLTAFYSHPWAWNEMGFGGPAYPRGYARIGAGQREHWEAPPEFDLDVAGGGNER